MDFWTIFDQFEIKNQHKFPFSVLDPSTPRPFDPRPLDPNCPGPAECAERLNNNNNNNYYFYYYYYYYYYEYGYL